LRGKRPQDYRRAGGGNPGANSSVIADWGGQTSRKVRKGEWTTPISGRVSPARTARWKGVLQTLALITRGRSCGRKKGRKRERKRPAKVIEIRQAGPGKYTRSSRLSAIKASSGNGPHRQTPAMHANPRAVIRESGPCAYVCLRSELNFMQKKPARQGLGSIVGKGKPLCWREPTLRIALIRPRDVGEPWAAAVVSRIKFGGLGLGNSSGSEEVSDTARWLREIARLYWTDRVNESTWAVPRSCARGGSAAFGMGRLESRTGVIGDYSRSLLQRVFGELRGRISLQSATGMPRGGTIGTFAQGKSMRQQQNLGWRSGPRQEGAMTRKSTGDCHPLCWGPLSVSVQAGLR